MPEPLVFSSVEKDAFRSEYAAAATDAQFDFFINECSRRALVPGVHVVFNLRSTTEYSQTLKSSVTVQKVAFLTTIYALRLIAQRDGNYEGHGPFTYYYNDEMSQQDGKFIESKIPLGRVPHAVSVEGYRKNWRVPLFSTARYASYVQMKDGGEEPTAMWALRGEEQTAKCCEALMLRTVAPEECAGLVIAEEMGSSLVRETESPAPVTPVEVPKATVAPAVNQAKAPAEGFGESTQRAIDDAQADLRRNVTESVKPTPVPAPSVAPAPPVDPKPQPTPAPAPAVTVAPAQAPSGGLFTENNRPDPAHETTAFAPDMMKVAPVPEVKLAVAGDTPCTSKEFSDFVNGRATKIIRDKLPKAGVKDSKAANGVKEFLLKGSGKTVLKSISAADFERLLSALEAGTPEETAALVTAQS